MQTRIKSIALNEVSYNVAALHKTLAILGLPVKKTEVQQNKAGPDTQKKLRALQKQLDITPDSTRLVDEATIAAIGTELKNRGLTAASRTFIVSGNVREVNGRLKKRQRLLAFDLDLRGVGIYHEAKTIAELAKSGGFEILGEAVSDNDGNYRISFYDWQYRRAERGLADVVVFAVQEGEELKRGGGGHIIGRSRLVATQDYSEKGVVENLNIVCEATDAGTEYELLMGAVTAFMKESETEFAEVAQSDEQLTFAANEIAVDLGRLRVAAAATRLESKKDRRLSHELLYGIGRQSIALDWTTLNKKADPGLKAAIAKSAEQNIIRAATEKEIIAFLAALRQLSAAHVLNGALSGSAGGSTNVLNTMLSSALPKETQRQSFVNAVASFQGQDFSEFWSKHLAAQPAFKDDPKLVSNLLLTQQLTLLSGNHQPLVNELQVNRKLDSIEKLLDLETKEWVAIAKKTGVPAFIQGATEEEKATVYASQLQSMLNAAFPTQRIVKLLEKNKLPIEKTAVAKGIAGFLSEHTQFDFASSRVHDFEKQIEGVAGKDAEAVILELKKMQRVFQVSTSPEAMSVLMQNNLHSAYSIANIPQKSFLKTYGPALGGETEALAIHQRASHIATRTEMAAMHMTEYSNAVTPQAAMNQAQYAYAMTALQNQVPNYTELFGRPDLCECEQCRSVYSAAAYFVDLLRFLWRGEPNSNGKTPLDMLKARRPDLLHLPLTCENTNTIVPYIDLANEVMEFYTANDSLTAFEGYDTGDTTTEELRAQPQNFDLEAYRKLKDAKYPFTLPYHQPLDAIRAYGDHLKVSRYDAMSAMNPQPDAATTRALASESLRLSQEEHRVIAGSAFDASADTTLPHQYYGYTAAGQLENLSAVPEFLHRSGVTYTDLVELVKTQFINPHQGKLDFLQEVFASTSLDPSTLYARLKQIEAGTLNPATDADITAAITAYNAAQGTSITPADFNTWVDDHLGEVREVITLFEPESKCDLESTTLRTIESIYENAATSGVTSDAWSKFHRLIRLWRKLGWTIHETDLMLAALDEGDIDADTIAELESVSLLKTATKLAPNMLASFWGNIDSYGDKSLYKKLFLSRTAPIDEGFKADAWGDYLQDTSEVLANHQSTILAAFRIREEDLAAILDVAEVVDNGVPRALDLAVDTLNLPNLSTLYRHVALAKALKTRVTDVCKLIELFDAVPFSTWDIQQEEFTGGSPADTYEFYKLAAATKDAGFKPATLEYILQGALPADSKIGLSETKVLNAAKDIRDAFAAIEQDHPDTPATPLTVEALTAKLWLTFQPEVVARFMGIIAGTATFEAITDDNLDIDIPEALANKYTYIEGSGRITCIGIVSDAERTTLQGLTNANVNFQAAVDELYEDSEVFIADNFGGVFSDLNEAYAMLLDHPAQTEAADLDEKLTYVYALFVPVLKAKLRRDAIVQHLASLIGLTEAATALLIADDVDVLIEDLSTEGFSATYFSDPGFTTPALSKADTTIDFAWNGDAPDPAVPADNFSARWSAYIAPPASGEYTLVTEVAESDEAFNLYLDDTLILEKAAADTNTSLEVITELNAAQLHRLKLEYTETSQNAGIRLQWKTTTSAPEPIPAESAFPAVILDKFIARATLWHRAAKFISGFELNEAELDHLLRYRADFAAIDFDALTSTHWQRVYDYAQLREAVPQAQATLTQIFAAANTTNPTPTVDALKDTLRLATAWDVTNIDFLVDTHFSLGVDDFKNEIALNRLRTVMAIVAKTGLSAETIAAWGDAETDFDVLHETAQLLQNTVKAKYEETDWLEIAGKLSNTLRMHQRDALIAYLLTRPAIKSWGAEDADGLFEYFLIDVQMGACMDTSRIVQANSSVQMFVSRCLLNLESVKSGSTEHGVSPGAIDKDRWEWMKNYRVWEANRKVFLYPENWLEPEWRNDRSEFFRALESYLVQNDITERSVEEAFRNYLTSLNDVANLEVCGMHKETYDDGALKYLHVFARTHNAPYKFFYRRWNEYRKWSAWEKVPLDIRCVENNTISGSILTPRSGVHLIPVLWKSRFFLFWPEFIQKEEKSNTDTNQSVEQASDDKLSELESKKYWEIRLAWSEYVDGKWAPKQLSKEAVKQSVGTVIPTESRLRWIHRFLGESLMITAHCEFDGGWHELGRFYMTDITSRVEPGMSGYVFENEWPGYGLSFMNYARSGKLELLNDEYLKNSVYHKLLVTPTRDDYAPRLEDPFFFSDAKRTYFVRPVDITIVDWIKHPDKYKPYLPGVSDKGKYYIEADKPNIFIDKTMPSDIRGGWTGGGGVPTGPDDYYEVAMPVTEMSAGGAGRPVGAMTGAGSAGGTRMAVMAMHASGAPTAAMSMARTRAMALKWTADDMDGYEMTYTGAAFAGYNDMYYVDFGKASIIRYDKGLEFHTFYHPYSGRYVKRLNQGGMDKLMASDTALASDEGATFVGAYNPNFTNGLVQKPSDFDSRTYYKENVCFDVYGANSIYNWELFFHAPLYIATRLSKNGKYEEAMRWFHYIFDPTTDALPGSGESEISRYWKVLPFKSTPAESLEDWFRDLAPNTNPDSENAIIAEWRDNPFDPHIVASNRPLAYMKHVVIKYVENLVAWGDSLFRQDTMESVNEALQIYVIANHILGPRPEIVPPRGEVKAESYESLKNKWDDFSNALVELENIFPYSSAATIADESTGTSLLGLGSTLYFGIPPNDKLLEHWDTVTDRLYKIRHCQNIDGVERKLALFAPAIDPGALIQAGAQGLSLGSILADLSSPPPIYRFTHLIQKANEFCSDVKEFGTLLLSTLEKKDAEELARLRAAQETQMLEMVKAVRERNVLDAKALKESLERARDAAEFRLDHYTALLGNDVITVPALPALAADLTADSQLPADTAIATIETDVDESLVATEDAGVKIIPKEKEDMDQSAEARSSTGTGSTIEAIGGLLNFIPNFSGNIEPFGCGMTISYGGSNLAGGMGGIARFYHGSASDSTAQAAMAAKTASFIRREQEWTLQANLAAKEIVQIDKQITGADIRVQVAEKELDNHLQQIEDAKAVELFLEDKFTNQELYQWMKEQLFAVYKQSYNVAYDMAKKAEKAYKYETGNQLASFIQYGYWDNSKQGLVSGEKLQLALRHLEKSWHEDNFRELELTKSVSLARLSPLALIELRETGQCQLSIPEELFDLDFRGHYFRRLKAVRLSIPCVAGPYTSVSCSLRLLNNSIRVNTSLNSEGNYEHENDEGLWIDDDRFRTNRVPVTAIATSGAQNDSGMFEFAFRDERYLPFERAGAISEWQIELSTEKELRQFNYATISDVILHLDYTARENGGLFKEKATDYIKDFIQNAADLAEQPLVQLFNMKHEFPTDWYKFLHPAVDGAEQILSTTIGKDRFPFFTQDRTIVIQSIDIFARCTEATSYHAILSYTDLDDEPVTSAAVVLQQNQDYGNLNKATVNVTDAGLDLEQIDLIKPIGIKLKRAAAGDYTALATVPDAEEDEVQDLYLVVHYKLEDA